MKPGVRESFLRFPDFTQHFWTWYTGKALVDQKPLFVHRWWSYLGLVVLVFGAGLSLSFLALSGVIFWVWCLLGMALTIWSSRSMVIVIAHQCIHNCFSGNRKIDALVGESVTILSVFHDLAEFRREHIDAHHRPSKFATSDDPPVQVLHELGLKPGMERARLWTQCWSVFVSPHFYLTGAGSRIRGNLFAGSFARRLAFVIWFSFWLSVPFWADHGLLVLTLGFVVPVIFAAQLSALLDKLGEHAWLSAPDPTDGTRYFFASASWARFCGDPVPGAMASSRDAVVGWVSWIIRALLYHLPSRVFVIVGDLPSHDYHHRFPGRSDWSTASYGRERDVRSGEGPPYREIWGMGAAIDESFQSIAAAPIAVGQLPEGSLTSSGING